MAISFWFGYFDNTPRQKKLLMWSRRKISMFNPIKQQLSFSWCCLKLCWRHLPKSVTELFISFLFIYLYRCCFRDLTENDNTSFVVWSDFLPPFIHLYHRRSWKQRIKFGHCAHLSSSTLMELGTKNENSGVWNSLRPRKVPVTIYQNNKP